LHNTKLINKVQTIRKQPKKRYRNQKMNKTNDYYAVSVHRYPYLGIIEELIKQKKYRNIAHAVESALDILAQKHHIVIQEVEA